MPARKSIANAGDEPLWNYVPCFKPADEEDIIVTQFNMNDVEKVGLRGDVVPQEEKDLAAGRPVTLIFVNHSGSGHDFTAQRFFANARIVSGNAADGEIELGPHQTRSVTLVPSAGTYKAHCSHFMHKQMGMSDVIIVD